MARLPRILAKFPTYWTTPAKISFNFEKGKISDEYISFIQDIHWKSLSRPFSEGEKGYLSMMKGWVYIWFLSSKIAMILRCQKITLILDKKLMWLFMWAIEHNFWKSFSIVASRLYECDPCDPVTQTHVTHINHVTQKKSFLPNPKF